MATTVVAQTRTRTLIGNALGIELATRTGGGYRDPDGTPFEGDWLGAFAQPGAVLSSASAMSASFSEHGGSIIDEYGESTVTYVRRTDRRVELVKRYAVSQFRYVGELRDGTFAGYWYSPARPQFNGVFWLARADRLDAATAEALRRRVRSTSPRRFLLQAAVAIVPIGFAVGLATSVPLACAMGVLPPLFIWRVRASSRALRDEVDAWRSVLAPGARLE